MLLCLLFYLTAQSLNASNYQLVSSEPNIPVVNMLEYDLCRLETEQHLIRSEYADNDLNGFLNKSFNVFLTTSIAWVLIYIDLLEKKPRWSGVFGVPAFYILPVVWFVSLCCFCKAAQDSQKDEKIETAKKMMREQLAVYRSRQSEDK
jgi:hypothetical protein